MNDINKIQSVQTEGVSKSKFNGSFTHKHTQKIADVVPNACVPIFPGDSFSGKVATAFNFPPLVSPAYQGFTQKSYMFRVRKGLVWHNDGIRNALNCLKTGESLAYVEPHVALSSGYYFGSNKYCIRFHPHIPVYGSMQNGLALLHKHDAYSDKNLGTQSFDGIGELSVNAFLQNHMDGFINSNFFSKANTRNMFSGFIANKSTHGLWTKNPLYFACSPFFNTHYMYQKGESIGSRFGFKAITNSWNASPDGVLKNGNKQIQNSDGINRTAQILTFYPFSDNFPNPFFNCTSSDAESDILFADVPIRADEELNPKGLKNFALGYVSDGLGGPSSLMEYLGLPSFNTSPYVDELSKRIVEPFCDFVSSSTIPLIQSVKSKIDYLNGVELGDGQTIEGLNQEFNQDFCLALDSASQGLSTCWDTQIKSFVALSIEGGKRLYGNYPLFDSQTQGFDPAEGHDNSQWFPCTMYDFMHMYALWCIENGYGDGTIPNDEDCPVIYVRNMANIFVAPVVTEDKSVATAKSYPCQSLCPWLSYWTIYEHFFRDANISPSLKPVLDHFKTASANRSFDTARNLIVRSASTDFVTWFGKDFSNTYQESLSSLLSTYPNLLYGLIYSWFKSYTGISTYTASDSQTRIVNPFVVLDGSFSAPSSLRNLLRTWRFRMECTAELTYPFRKLLDKDLFTSILPTTSKVEVFAPSFSSSDLATLYDGKQMFVGLDEELSRGANSTTSAQPFKLDDANLPTISNYIDVDAFRTAKILQSYYRDASLVGDQINQFIYLTFGERSQDFRPEVPELIFARESPCHISEITQQSETSELPLGTEGGKMSSSSSAISFDVNSHGDFGYFIYMTCIYPETENNNGLNHQFDVSFNQFEQLFVPRFATLGEEGLTALQVDCQPKCKLDQLGRNAQTKSFLEEDTSRVIGYVPRYALFKRIPSYISGRFKGDLNSWTLDRIPNPFEERMHLTHGYLETPRDLRLFASDEEENCLGFTAFSMSFVRGVASNDYQPVI